MQSVKTKHLLLSFWACRRKIKTHNLATLNNSGEMTLPVLEEGRWLRSAGTLLHAVSFWRKLWVRIQLREWTWPGWLPTRPGCLSQATTWKPAQRPCQLQPSWSCVGVDQQNQKWSQRPDGSLGPAEAATFWPRRWQKPLKNALKKGRLSTCCLCCAAGAASTKQREGCVN